MNDKPAEQQDQPDDSVPVPERQAELRAGYTANIKARKKPYEGIAIRTRGEVLWICRERGWDKPDVRRWLLTMGANFQCAIFKGAKLQGINLKAANLRQANLDGANLHGANLRQAWLDGASLQGADLGAANLSGSDRSTSFTFLRNSSLIVGLPLLLALVGIAVYNAASLGSVVWVRAIVVLPWFLGILLAVQTLYGAEAAVIGAVYPWTGRWFIRRRRGRESRSNGTNMSGANLQEAIARNLELPDMVLRGAYLEGADLSGSWLIGADLSEAYLQGTNLSDAKLFLSRIESVAALQNAILDSRSRLDQVRWDNVPPTRSRVGKGLSSHVAWYRDQSRICRTVGLALRSQGLFAQASTYRLLEQRSERKALFWELNFFPWLGSLLLGMVAGYGERWGRIFATYLVVVAGFATAYWVVSNNLETKLSRLSWGESLVLSITAFHGRGFFPTFLSMGDLTLPRIHPGDAQATPAAIRYVSA